VFRLAAFVALGQVSLPILPTSLFRSVTAATENYSIYCLCLLCLTAFSVAQIYDLCLPSPLCSVYLVVATTKYAEQRIKIGVLLGNHNSFVQH
jgi:hypothetical protein